MASFIVTITMYAAATADNVMMVNCTLDFCPMEQLTQ